MLDTIIGEDRRVFHHTEIMSRASPPLATQWDIWILAREFLSTTDVNVCGRSQRGGTSGRCGGCKGCLFGLTWGVEQPPGDRRFRSAIGKTGESHVAALIDNDVLRHFVDAGWNCRHKKHHSSWKTGQSLRINPHFGLFIDPFPLRNDVKTQSN